MPPPTAPPVEHSSCPTIERPTPGRRRGLVLAVFVVVGALALLSGKAFTIDDTLFLWLGQHLRSDPFDFYGFDVNWYGTSMGMWEVTMNPPATGYLIALAGALFGESERALHLVFLIPAAACAAGTYQLAARLCNHPFAAAAIGLLTPVYLISASNVMSDGPMLAVWVWTLVLWLRHVDGASASDGSSLAGGSLNGWTAGLLAALCALTKYFGVALIPLMAAYALARHVRLRSWLPPLLLTLLALVAYQLATQAMYGRGLLLGAARYASEAHWDGGGHSFAARTWIGLAFAGGCVAPALFFAPLTLGARTTAAALVLTASAWWATSRIESWGWLGPMFEVPPPGHYRLQLVIFALAGVALLGVTLRDLARRRDADSLLLALWILGTLVFASYVNWVNNGRSNLPLAPAAGILIVRALEARSGAARAVGTAPGEALGRIGLGRIGPGRVALGRASLGIAFTLSVALAGWTAFADLRWAGDVRQAARDITREYATPDRPLHFYGHWGFQWYMEQAGAIPVDLNDSTLERRQLFVYPTPASNTNVYPPPSGFETVELRWTPSPAGLHTISRRNGACFYASVIGPLPFVFAPALRENGYVVGRTTHGFVYDSSFDLQVERF